MDFLMDENGDLAVVSGDFALVSGTDETVQFLIQSLRFIQQEWFLDETLGFPYFDEVFVKNPDPEVITSAYKTYILGLPGILEILEFDLDYDPAARDLSIVGTFRALDGEATFTFNTTLPGGGA